MSDKENFDSSEMSLSLSNSRLNETDRSEVRKMYKTILDKISGEEVGLAGTQKDEEVINSALDKVGRQCWFIFC
jgi:hypothetical protein